jgi:4-amino-4-deoxy-L-arabinose transferase-like glycosyltransferase
MRLRLEAAGSLFSYPLLPAVAAVLIAAACSFLVYPEVAGSLNNKITTDRYDELALGIYHNGTLSFFPDPTPTVLRAPFYPLLLAAVFSLGEQLIPSSVQIVQAFLHGLTCLLAFQIGKMLCGPRRAPLVALLCAIHPYLLWYAGRLVIETVSVLLFTLIVFCVLRLPSRPTILRALLTGLAVGAGVLCKSTYLLFIFVIPLLLYFSRPRRTPLLHVLLVLAVSLATIAPWIIRNHAVSGQWGIVQGLTGYNFYVGDAFVERYAGSPLSYTAIIARTDFSRMDEGLPDHIRQTSGPRRETLQDEWLLSRSVERYLEDPPFLLAKIAANAVMFWTLGSTPAVSILTMVLQLPLLFFFVRSAAKRMRRGGPFCPECIPIWLITVYFAIHLPVYALARFSVVFIPTMMAYAFLRISDHDSPATDRS